MVKKYIIITITIITVICAFIMFIICYYNKERVIKLEMVGEMPADFSEIYFGYGDKVKDDFTWWYQAATEGQLEYLGERFKFDSTKVNFNFKDYYAIVSLGRKLDYLVYQKKDKLYKYAYCAYPQFDEDTYDKKAYIYAMKKIPLMDMEFYGISFLEQNYKDY